MTIKYFDFDEVDSTNNVAIEKLQQETNKENVLIVVTANSQTAGRGRNKKPWYSSKDENLYFSCAFCHDIDELPLHAIQMIGGLAAYSVAVELLTENNVRLKYPNDVHVIDSATRKSTKKIAGIIAEHNFAFQTICDSLIGIGINNKQQTFPEAINHIATSLALNKCNISNNELKIKLTNSIVELLKAGFNIIFELWKSKIDLSNKKINVVGNTSDYFMLKDFLPDGTLLLSDQHGNERQINNGDSIVYDLL